MNSISSTRDKIISATYLEGLIFYMFLITENELEELSFMFWSISLLFAIFHVTFEFAILDSSNAHVFFRIIGVSLSSNNRHWSR